MIKKILYIVIIGGLFLTQNAYSQRIMGEAIIGLNMSKIEGDLVNNGSLKFQKPGLVVGAGAIVPINDLFSVNIQALFNQKGAYKRNGIYEDSVPYYKARLDYAEVPLIFQYNDKNGLTIGTGFSYSRLVRVQWIVNGQEVSNTLSDGYFAQDNVDWIADFKYRIWKSASINVRYQYGLTSLWSGDDEDLLINQNDQKQSSDQRHSVLSIRLTWTLGATQSKNLRKGIE
ncbi:outer membrane beta-barrel protein [Lentimicrobium sp. L6]|uniref:outer membrane beta-barrel protein n=1 Tax=Lentimicrobium sp. L6 TaxID=2735916 RepID=UPI0015551E30|nr:outer membrane beta-barrel protein [Lentimicrobium sp. L6]NPD86899.1 outer membrane beta-barrel protein [Lentimicrobium sp. L6]